MANQTRASTLWKHLFPYDTPYENQQDGIETSIETAAENGYTVIEGACGTGKTLLALTAGLSLVEAGEYDRVLVLTSVKQQLTQFETDLRAINENAPAPHEFDAVTLVGKGDVCAYSSHESATTDPVSVDIEQLAESVQQGCQALRENTTGLVSGQAADWRETVQSALDELADNGYGPADITDDTTVDELPVTFGDVEAPLTAEEFVELAALPADERRTWLDQLEEQRWQPVAADDLADSARADGGDDRVEFGDVTTPFQATVPDADGLSYCPFYAQHIGNADGQPFEFGDGPISNRVVDPGTVSRVTADEQTAGSVIQKPGNTPGACPHAAMFNAALNADVVIGNYYHLFAEQSREVLADSGLLSDRTFVVVDEAHNLEDRVRELQETNVPIDTVSDARQTLETLLDELADSDAGHVDPDDDEGHIGYRLPATEEDAKNTFVTRRSLESALSCFDDLADWLDEEAEQAVAAEHERWQEIARGAGNEPFEGPYPELGMDDTEAPIDDPNAPGDSDGYPDVFSDARVKCMHAAAWFINKAIRCVEEIPAFRDEDGQNTAQLDDTEYGEDLLQEDAGATTTDRPTIPKDTLHRFEQECLEVVNEVLLDGSGQRTQSVVFESLEELFEEWYVGDDAEHYRELTLTRTWREQYRHDDWRRIFTASLTVNDCLPTEAIRDHLAGLGGGILMSATLEPLDVFTEVTGLDQLEAQTDRPVETRSYPLPFGERRRGSLIVDADWFVRTNRGDTPTGENAELRTTETRREYADIIESVVHRTPGNVLICMPNYEEAEWAHKVVQQSQCDKPVLLDRSSSHDETSRLKQQFFAGNEKVLVTSALGTLTEGVDYHGDRLGSVLVCGVPLQQLTPKRRAVSKAYEARFGDDGSAPDSIWESKGGQYAMTIPAVRKARQAIGRVIRGEDDLGVRILADERYADPDKCNQYLAASERDEFRAITANGLPTSLDLFWEDVAPSCIE